DLYCASRDEPFDLNPVKLRHPQVDYHQHVGKRKEQQQYRASQTENRRKQDTWNRKTEQVEQYIRHHDSTLQAVVSAPGSKQHDTHRFDDDCDIERDRIVLYVVQVVLELMTRILD